MNICIYKYVGFPYCRTEMYAGRVAYLPLVNYGKYADGTDRRTDRTPGRSIALSAMDTASLLIVSQILKCTKTNSQRWAI